MSDESEEEDASQLERVWEEKERALALVFASVGAFE